MKVNLICFPFAGGNKYAYLPFRDHVDPDIQMLFFEPPGRGDRYRTPLLRNINAVIGDLFSQIHDHLQQPYAFFGHSMGAMCSYLLCRKILEEGLPLPTHLFLSGRVPPNHIDEGDRLYKLKKEEFWKSIKEYGGSPEELLNYPELMDLYEPMIRADLEALDTYKFVEEPPLDIDMSILIGTREKVTYESAKDWQHYSSHPIQIHQFNGDHFFILKYIPEISALFKKVLLNDPKVQTG